MIALFHNSILILKEHFLTKDGFDRVNIMRLKTFEDGCIQVWVNNGDKYGTFRLHPDNIAKLKQFLK